VEKMHVSNYLGQYSTFNFLYEEEIYKLSPKDDYFDVYKNYVHPDNTRFFGWIDANIT